MIDVRFLRKETELVRLAIQQKKQKEIDIEAILDLEQKKRAKLTQVEELNHQRNQKNRQVAQSIDAGTPPALLEEMTTLSEQIKNLNHEIQVLDEELTPQLAWIPNLPDPDVPIGNEENNQIIRTWGEPKPFPFTPKPHWDIGTRLGILDIERGGRMSGSGFPVLKGKGALLERALLNFMLSVHTEEHHYEEIAPPHLVQREALFVTGQLPKMEEDMYALKDMDSFLIPTAEVSLINFYREEIFSAEELPIKLVGASSCFRREAGAHGRDTRGLLRVHEFKKVELIQFVEPEQSDLALDKLVQEAEVILQRLQIPYRVVLLATEEMSFASAKTYDIEVWAPGLNRWLEVSSCSNCRDFQARRGNIRYKKTGEKPRLLHILNGSGVAIPRLWIALLENFQQENGDIFLPLALHPYLPTALYTIEQNTKKE